MPSHSNKPPDQPKRVWTGAGSVRLANQGDDITDAYATITQAIRDDTFHLNIDQQVMVIGHLRRFRHLLGDQSLSNLLVEMCERFEGVMTLARLRAILTLDNPVHVRDALECKRFDSRPPDDRDDLYPKNGWLGAYLAYARESNAPTAFHFWVGVTLLGAAMRRNVYLSVGPYKLYPNQYLMMVGDSALGKGTSFDIGEPVIRLANDMLLDYFKEFHWAAGIEYPPDRRVKMLEKIATPERLLETLKPQDFEITADPDNVEMPPMLAGVDSVGLFMNEELVSTASQHLYGAGGLFHIFTGLYTCPDVYDKGTVGRKNDTLINVALSIALGSTLEWINKSITPDMFEGGFMSRCMFCYRPRVDAHDYFHFAIGPPLDPVLRQVLARTLVPWMSLGVPRPVVFTPGALGLWSEIKEANLMAMANAADPRLIPYYRRRDNHIGKLAMALMASEIVADFETFDIDLLEARTSFTLNERILTQAKLIIEREEVFMPECFSKIGEHRDSAKLDTVVAAVMRYNKEHQAPMPLHLVNRKAKEIFGLDGPRNIGIMEGMGLLRKITLPHKPGAKLSHAFWAKTWATQVPPELPTATKE